MEHDGWTLYEAQEFRDRKAILYKHNEYEVWLVIEEQEERGKTTQFATMFVDRDEHDSLQEEIDSSAKRVIHAINVSLMWNVRELRPLVGGVSEAYTFGDFV